MSDVGTCKHPIIVVEVDARCTCAGKCTNALHVAYVKRMRQRVLDAAEQIMSEPTNKAGRREQ